MRRRGRRIGGNRVVPSHHLWSTVHACMLEKRPTRVSQKNAVKICLPLLVSGVFLRDRVQTTQRSGMRRILILSR